ncbi:hypothetical protein A5660_04370 [Mycobacterium alsense]|uniref:DUF805 domain-containing protein n=1 Tax=Mycobacterium alsense TaxID=324058 RepID=UPI0007FF1281|nr:DUF805 domain-containing protein [Mycobacterium alsense]OBI98829.1 hypothetical protein A5660_04370 [Mycobacterium alsense]
MGFGQAISAGFAKYFNFSDRSCRSEYWYWVLFTTLVAIAGNVGNVMLHTRAVNIILSLPFIIPSWAIAVRRLHDIDRTGWWVLISFVPIVGAIVLIIFFVNRGTDGPNRFGADPLAAEPSPNQQFGAPA